MDDEIAFVQFAEIDLSAVAFRHDRADVAHAGKATE